MHYFRSRSRSVSPSEDRGGAYCFAHAHPVIRQPASVHSDDTHSNRNAFLAWGVDLPQQPCHVLSEDFHGLNALLVLLHFAGLTADADVPIR